MQRKKWSGHRLKRERPTCTERKSLIESADGRMAYQFAPSSPFFCQLRDIEIFHQLSPTLRAK
ncbi:MAG: hypothetical protein DMG97_10975 [Acidobacteria bacterium]|nr:MAG: hypothetical protein DMG97_10975 [Acidobacteriota bacterium]